MIGLVDHPVRIGVALAHHFVLVLCISQRGILLRMVTSRNLCLRPSLLILMTEKDKNQHLAEEQAHGEEKHHVKRFENFADVVLRTHTQ